MHPVELFCIIWRLAGLWLAALVFLLPLRRRSLPVWQAAAGTAVCIALRVLLLQVTLGGGAAGLWVCYLASYLLVTTVTALWTDQAPTGTLYCGVWALVLYYLGDSLLLICRRAAEFWQLAPAPALAAAALPVLIFYLVVGCTLARFMPVNHQYQIGPRETASAFVLLALILLLSQLSHTHWYQEDDWAVWVFPLLIEVYCATLLYLQHELFKKSYLSQDLAMLNQLWAQQKSQYALDNAIEHVRCIQDKERRIIDVLVYAENKLLAIQVSNPVQSAPRFGADGLPVSTKSGDGPHGYGLKSVRHAVQKYGGFLTVKVEDGCFHLRILLPVKS